MKIAKKHYLAFAIFTIIGIIALQIPFTRIVGSGQNFSAFDFMGPSIGMILGPIGGAISVLFVKGASAIGTQSFDFLTIVRFFPMILAAIYFGMKSKKIIAVPILAIILFNLHPEGRQAWFYSMFWLIPVFTAFTKKSLIFNSLGSTFTAHAVGSTIFLYAFNLPAAVWVALIPIVMIERGLFALGIWVSYLVFNTALEKLTVKPGFASLRFLVRPNYILSKKFFKSFA